jgi:hypothetical protein
MAEYLAFNKGAVVNIILGQDLQSVPVILPTGGGALAPRLGC